MPGRLGASLATVGPMPDALASRHSSTNILDLPAEGGEQSERVCGSRKVTPFSKNVPIFWDPHIRSLCSPS